MATQADIALRFFLDERSEADVARLLNISNATLRRWKRSGVPKKEAARVISTYRAAQQQDQIEALLYDAQECTAKLLGHSPMVRVVRNRDLTVDGQLTLYDIPRGVGVTGASGLMADLSECASALRNLSAAFLQIGVRWGARGSDKPPESGDRRHRGLAEATTYWYRSDRYGDMFVYALDICKRVAAKSRNRKIELVFIRVHWNEQGRQPAR